MALRCPSLLLISYQTHSWVLMRTPGQKWVEWRVQVGEIQEKEYAKKREVGSKIQDVKKKDESVCFPISQKRDATPPEF